MINLFNEDCLPAMRRMKDKQYDIAICDPPYGIGHIKNNLFGLIEWNEEIPEKEYFTQLFRVSRNQIIWGENYLNPFIPNGGRIVWNKLLTPIYEKTFSQCEIAYCSMQKRISIFNYQWSGNVQNGKMNIKNIGIDSRIHPTQKPVSLYEWLLTHYAKFGDTILDTHGGSMSIAIACDILGFDLDLYEIDEDYFRAGKERLERHQKQHKLEFE